MNKIIFFSILFFIGLSIYYIYNIDKQLQKVKLDLNDIKRKQELFEGLNKEDECDTEGESTECETEDEVKEEDKEKDEDLLTFKKKIDRRNSMFKNGISILDTIREEFGDKIEKDDRDTKDESINNENTCKLDEFGFPIEEYQSDNSFDELFNEDGQDEPCIIELSGSSSGDDLIDDAPIVKLSTKKPVVKVSNNMPKNLLEDIKKNKPVEEEIGKDDTDDTTKDDTDSLIVNYNKEEMKNCIKVLKSGKRKGELCGISSREDYCQRHNR